MAKKIRKISFTRLATDEVFGMQCRLAWQWTIDNISYEDVIEALLGEDSIVIPDSKYSQKEVVPICEFKGAPYDVDGSESISKLRKKVDDIYGGTKGFLGRASMLDDKDDAYNFIDRLEAVQNLYQMVKDKKPLPQEDPFRKGKKPQPVQQESTTAPTRQTTQQKAPILDGDWFSKYAQRTAGEPELEELEAFDPQEALAELFAEDRPNFNFLVQFNPDDLALALDDLGQNGRNEAFKDLKAEYDTIHAALEKFDETYAKYVKYIATAIVSFGDKDSAAYPFSAQAEDAAKQKKNQQRNNGNGRNQQQGNRQQNGNQNQNQNQNQGDNSNQQSQQEQRQAQYVKRQKERLEKKILAAVKDHDNWWLSVYSAMQEYLEVENMEVFEAFRSTEKDIIAAEQNGDDSTELFSMMDALVNGDFEAYGNMKAQRDLGSGAAGDDQQSGYSYNHSGSNTGFGSGQQSQQDTGDTGSGQSQQDDSNNQGTGKLYSVNGILSWMEMLGVTSVPKALEFVPDHERDKEQITGQFINKYMEQIGLDARLPE